MVHITFMNGAEMFDYKNTKSLKQSVNIIKLSNTDTI